MSLQDYMIEERFDFFEARERDGEFCFPCIACVSNTRPNITDPCRKCGHNIGEKDALEMADKAGAA